MEYYNKKYFEWQKHMGEFGGKANLFMFEEFVRNTDVVVDFGAGGGYILNSLKCKKRIGIDINQAARYQAEKFGIEMFENSLKCKSDIADVIISDNALEHVKSPYSEICNLKRILKKDGKLVFVVPWERKGNKYIRDDINMHLYTWSPQNLGNLFKSAGYKVKKIDIIRHTWPPNYENIYNHFGRKIFDVTSKLYSKINGIYQLRIVCKK